MTRSGGGRESMPICAEERPPLGSSAMSHAGLAAGELRYRRCDCCGVAYHRPRVVCPGCDAPRCRWEANAGYGVVYSVTRVERHPPPHEGPRCVVLVDLDEGIGVVEWPMAWAPASAIASCSAENSCPKSASPHMRGLPRRRPADDRYRWGQDVATLHRP